MSGITGDGSGETLPSRPDLKGMSSDYGDQATPPSINHRHRLHWLVALGGPVLLTVAIAVVVLVVVQRSMEIPLGQGTATFTWQNTGDEQNGSKQPFSGTASGYQVSGEVTQPKDVFGKNLTPAEIESGTLKFPKVIPISDIRGNIDGRHFTLMPELSFSALDGAASSSQEKDTCTTTSTPDSSSTVCSAPPSVTKARLKAFPHHFPIGNATGTFGSIRINAGLTVDTADLTHVTSATPTLGFTGTIGTLHISGIIKIVDHGGRTETAHTSFDVTK